MQADSILYLLSRKHMCYEREKETEGRVLLGSTVSWNQYRYWLKQLIPKEHAWSNTATRKWVGHFEILYKTVLRKDKTIWLLKPVWILTMPFIALVTVTTSSSWIFGTLVCLSVDTLHRHLAARLRDLLCSSRKYPYPKPPRRVTELPRRGGSPKGGNFPGCWGLVTEVFFQGSEQPLCCTSYQFFLLLLVFQNKYYRLPWSSFIYGQLNAFHGLRDSFF